MLDNTCGRNYSQNRQEVWLKLARKIIHSIMKDNPFRSRKIHGYKKVKTEDTSTIIRRELPRVFFGIIFIRVVIVFGMLFIAEYSPDVKGMLDFLYHFIDNMAWLSIGIYFFYIHLTEHGHFKSIMHLERVSLIAFISSLVNVIITAAYSFPEIVSKGWLAIYYICQVVIWTMLTLYLYVYWKHCKHKRKHIERKMKS